MGRPDVDEYFIKMASLVSTRGTCSRRKVGCVLVNRRNHVVATGYNGNYAGSPHCIDTPCPGSNLPSGQGLEKCEAIHAEQNALLQCKDVFDILTCYTTSAPCIHCIKLLLNTTCSRIVFMDSYPHSESKELWEKAGRIWVQIEDLPRTVEVDKLDPNDIIDQEDIKKAREEIIDSTVWKANPTDLTQNIVDYFQEQCWRCKDGYCIEHGVTTALRDSCIYCERGECGYHM